MNGKYILAHDVGTAGDKAVLTDLQGHIVCSSYTPYTVEYPRPEWAEQDADALWEAVARTTRRVIDKAKVNAADIVGLGVSAQMFNILPVDENIRPLTKMMSWLDMRSIAQADRMLENVRADFLFRCTGNIPTAKDIIPKILWLKEERPEIWARTYKLLDCKEYIIYQLTGKVAIDWHGASVYFLFDPLQKEWSQEACQALEIPVEMLPGAYPCTEVVGGVSPTASKMTGLRPGTPVVICAGDVGVAQVGSGAVGDGKAHRSSLYRHCHLGRPVQQPFFERSGETIWALNHVDPNKWIIAGEMETGGGSLMWFRDTLCQQETEEARQAGLSTYQLLSQMADKIEPGADRLIFPSWLSGERAPVLDHYARGGFVGLALGHTKAHMARAVMEGVAYHPKWIIEALEKLGMTMTVLNAIGGGSTSSTWVQIIADVIGRELHIVESPQEAGAIGAALTVAVGLGFYPDMEIIDELVRFSRIIEPHNDDRQGRYEALYQNYKAIYQVLVPIYKNLHRAVS